MLRYKVRQSRSPNNICIAVRSGRIMPQMPRRIRAVRSMEERRTYFPALSVRAPRIRAGSRIPAMSQKRLNTGTANGTMRQTAAVFPGVILCSSGHTQNISDADA